MTSKPPPCPAVVLAACLTCSSATVAAAARGAAADPTTPTAPRSDDPLLVHVGALHVGDGTVLRPGEVLVDAGVVKAVGQSLEAPEGARRWDRADAVLTPGLVEPRALVPLAPSEGTRGTQAVLFEAVDARDPWDPRLEEVRGEGVVAVCLVPDGSGAFSGRAAAIGTEGPGPAGAPVLRRHAALVASLESTAASSAARAAARTRPWRALEAAERYGDRWTEWKKWDAEHAGGSKRRRADRKGGEPEAPKKPSHSEEQEVLLQVHRRELPLRLHADRVESLRAALGLARARRIQVVITGALEGARMARELEESRAIVLLSPLTHPVREGPRGEPDPGWVARLDGAGVRLAVTGGGPWPGGSTWLRLAAADLVRLGARPETAIAAMTSNAAAACGLEASHGLVAAGREARFLLWSGDPLRPGTRLLQLVTPDGTRGAAGEGGRS